MKVYGEKKNGPSIRKRSNKERKTLNKYDQKTLKFLVWEQISLAHKLNGVVTHIKPVLEWKFM